MNLYIIYNYWEILLSLLVLEKNKDRNNILLIVENEIEEDLLRRIEKKYKVLRFNIKPNKFSKFLTYYYKINYQFPKKIGQFLSNIERIISFSDQDVITRYFIKNKKYIDLFEHGVINYQTEFDGIEQKIKRIIFKMEKPYGRSKYVKNIFLRGSGKIPEDIKNKVKIIDLKELWNQLDFSSRNKILNVFGLDVEKLKIIETKNIILFTQPFSEDKVISEDEKIDLYKKIIKDYDRKSLVIKAHPREKTEYNKIFEDIMVLENTFPAELLLLNEFKFEKVVTISSTAVSVFFNKSEIDFYGSEVHPKILKYFGNLDFFMKRNKFIEECSDSLEI